jgi:hypothetical protein
MSLTTKTLEHVVLPCNLPRGRAVQGKVAEAAQKTAQAEAPHAALAAQPAVPAVDEAGRIDQPTGCRYLVSYSDTISVSLNYHRLRPVGVAERQIALPPVTAKERDMLNNLGSVLIPARFS